VLTLFAGPEATKAELEDLEERLGAYFPELELELHPGGPELYDYVAVLE